MPRSEPDDIAVVNAIAGLLGLVPRTIDAERIQEIDTRILSVEEGSMSVLWRRMGRWEEMLAQAEAYTHPARFL